MSTNQDARMMSVPLETFSLLNHLKFNQGFLEDESSRLRQKLSTLSIDKDTSDEINEIVLRIETLTNSSKKSTSQLMQICAEDRPAVPGLVKRIFSFLKNTF